MSALYFILGITAKVNASLWRYRFNFIPINVAVIGGVIVLGSATFSSAVEALNNTATPLSISIAHIHDDASIPQNYVAVEGIDIPVAVFEKQGKHGIVHSSWSPLLDTESHRILLVEKSGSPADGDPHEATISGMLRPMESDLRSSLASENDEIQGVPVETRYVLVADKSPGETTSNLVFSVMLFGIAGLFAVASLKRNIIFQPTGRMYASSEAADAEHLEVETTGTFAFDKSSKWIHQRFINVPAMLVQLESGPLALLSNIDASNRFMGVKTSDRLGIWSVQIEPGSVRNAQTGLLYWGTSNRPAFRFSYTDAVDRSQRQAIIASENEETLGAAITRVGAA